MSKGNEKIGKPVSKQDMDRRVEAARESYNRHKDAAAEAVGHVYLLYGETRSGEPRKWLEEEIKELNRDIEKHNTKLQNEYELAKSWKDKKLPKDHALLQPTDDADQIAYSNASGHAFQYEAGRGFRFEAGHPWLLLQVFFDDVS